MTADKENKETLTEDEDCCAGGKVKDGKCKMPEVTFQAFVMSLNTSALYHLGVIADPETGSSKQDLVMVQHVIDTLDMLVSKTRGNLTEDEDKMLGEFVYDLKMRYVKVAQS